MTVDVQVRAQRLLAAAQVSLAKFSLVASCTRGKAVMLSGAGIAAHDGNPDSAVVGVLMEDGDAGQERLVQLLGPADSSVVSLGAGAAERVGMTAAGALARESDVACISAPMFVGRVNADGRLFIRPDMPGPQGVAGGTSVMQRIAKSALVKGRAVMNATAGMTSSNGSRSRVHAGVALTDGALNDSVSAQLAGWLPADVASLGAGTACAVGMKSDGTLCRATDAACVSAPSWVGECDDAGNVFLSPRRDVVLNVLDFGADPSGIADSGAAVAAALARASKGDIVFFPPGVFKFTASVGPVPAGVTLRGSGWGQSTGSRLLFSGNCDGIIACYHTNQNSEWNVRIERMVIDRTGAAGPWGAVAMTGDGLISVSHVQTAGTWRYGLIVDGCEVSTFSECQLGHGYGDIDSAGMWFVQVNSRNFTAADSTNVHSVRAVHVNGPTIGFWVEQGASLGIHDCLVNVYPDGCFAKIGRALNVTFDNCYSEHGGIAGNAAHFKFGDNNSNLIAYCVTIRNHLASGAGPFIALNSPDLAHHGTAYNLRIEDNYMSCDWITGSQYITGPLHASGNYMSNARPHMFDVEPGSTGGWSSNFAAESIGRQGTAHNPLATHHWAAANYTDDMHLDTYSADKRRGWGPKSRSKQQGWERVVSAYTSKSSGWDRCVEHVGIPANAAAEVVGKVAILDGASGRVTIFVQAGTVDDNFQGSWEYTQRFRRYAGSFVTLVGSPVEKYASTDSGWTAPVIIEDSVNNTIGASCSSRGDQSAYYTVRVEIDCVHP